MVAEPLLIEFSEEHRASVVTRMSSMAALEQGWINFTPGLDMDFPPPQRSVLASIFGARGPDVPLATWKPAGKADREPSTVGIHHSQGPKVAGRLSEAGLAIPEGWRMLQDHPKHGLVCAVPPDADLDTVLDWLLRATTSLCRFPLTGEWRALCYRAI
ncbi:MAG TPA: hypothetical protein VGJ86_02600 [Acidimicrobiales bacterium]|jgi:hypothetical protein